MDRKEKENDRKRSTVAITSRNEKANETNEDNNDYAMHENAK